MLKLCRRFFGSVNLYKFNEAALNQLQALHDSLERVDDIATLSFDGTVLTAEIDQKHYIVINKHEASQQIWYSSFSGVDYFAKMGDKWLSNRSGRELNSVVSEDVSKATGRSLEVDALVD
ncbi:hypothetical protein X943_001661 [Babesia divergens]|uniref:Iron donor protein CyaY n=1 Tax=Babesia divergens TaxID=32595 RepID=A0AAD9LLI3_BABDI|nr:hypothetical protein X943_001661 [Babesia divergens]